MTTATPYGRVYNFLQSIPRPAAVEIIKRLYGAFGLGRRSSEEHGLLFGVIGLAFDNWPEKHSFTPDDAEHLRAWLAIEVGHCERFEADASAFTSPKEAIALARFFCGGRRDFRAFRNDDKLIMLRPRSISEREINVKEFRDVAARMYDMIEAITGITPEIYKAEQDGAAYQRAEIEREKVAAA